VTVGPRFRLVPPEALRWSAGGEAPWLAEFGTDLEAVVRATASLGLRCALEGERVRLMAPRSALEALRDELARRGAKGATEALARALEPVRVWRLRGIDFPLDRPIVMGIVNATDDSFSGDGVGRDPARAIERGIALAEAGADIIDVGGESARADRPQADPREEGTLVAQVAEGLAAHGIAVSVDTYKPEVAQAALAAGAVLVNDISGLTLGTGAAEAARAVGAGYVLNFSYERPKRRPNPPPQYTDVVLETLAWLESRLPQLWRLGLAPEQVAIDPGIAFGKSHDEDLQVLRRLGEFTSFGLPLLLAHSRKNFIGSATGRPPDDRDLETHVVTAFAYWHGARIFRVHDVAGARRALAMAEALASRPPGAFAPDAGSWPWARDARAPHAAGPGAATPPPPGQRW
jgi:dihydropteroate synthase